MLLVVDVGNTNIVFGIYKEDKLQDNWRISTEKSRTIDEYGLLFYQVLKYNKLKLEDIKDVIISSVVPSLMETLPNMCRRYFNIEPIVVGPGVKTGMEIRYDNPKEVGADRIVNAVAGYEKYKGPLIIVDFGTAITFDVISKDGAYLGGAITPGIHISSEALFMTTAKLPKVEISKPNSVIGKNTVNSIQAGLTYGYVGLVDKIIEEIMEELGEETRVIATGGLAKMIVPESKYVDSIDKFLTLEGLKLIYERNKN